MIRRARPSEAAILSDLAIRSKSHWQYTPEELSVFRGELTITSAQLAENQAYVAEEAGTIVGFYTLTSPGHGEAELEHLFVESTELTRGIGSRLFRHASQTARANGARTLVIPSDPNAAGFYHSLGATLEREVPSSIPGRTLPYFTLELMRADAGDR